MSARKATREVLRKRADAWNAALNDPDASYAENFVGSFGKWVEGLQKAHPEARLDSWANLLTGHGTARDKTTATFFQQEGQLGFPLLESLYHNDDLAARIVDAEPEQVWREGFEIHLVETAPDDDEDDREDADDPLAAALPPPGTPKPQRRPFGDLENELVEDCEELEVAETFELTEVLARLYGGAAIYAGADDGQTADKPLNEDKIKSVDFLHVLDRYSLWPATWYSDPTKKNFGKPETYWIFVPTIGGVAPPIYTAVHETRLIMFPGARTSVRKRIVNFGWEDSILQRPNRVLQQFGLSWAAATHLLSDASQGVLKVKNLLDMIVGQNKEELLARGELIDLMKSNVRMLMVDADEEDYERAATPFSGIPEMLDRMALRLAAAAPMPVTVLMGEEPAGLNATGDSSMRLWYDRIRMRQKKVAAPRLRRLIGMMLAARGRKDLKASIKWLPLYQPTGKELAEEKYITAQTDMIYVDGGMLLEEEVRESRFGGDGWSPETTIDTDITGEALQAIKEARNPEPPPFDPNAPGGDDAKPREDWDPDQPREENGEWGEGSHMANTQHSTAAKKSADRASLKANKSGGATDHQKAAAAHEAAARFADKAAATAPAAHQTAFKARADLHRAKAALHSAKAALAI